MQLPNVEEMSSAEKKWFAHSIAGMVVADGRADQSEMNFLREAINFMEDKEEVSKIMNVIKEGKTPEMSPLAIDPKQAFLMLKYLAQLMVADAHLDTKEIRFFLLSGRLLGFNNEILTKFWKSARALLEKDLPQAIIETPNLKSKVSLTKVDEAGFWFRMNKALMPNVKIRLKVCKPFQSDHPIEGDDAYWDVVTCKMLKQRQVKFDEGCYMVRATFEQKLADFHGILQIIHPENYAVVSDGGFIKTNKNSLLGSNVRCFICDNPSIKFYVLHSKSMITEPNIFGVSSYISSVGKLDFCDFNLIQVSSCSKCGFSSNEKEHFKSLKTDKPNFSVEQFSAGWEEKVSPLLKKAQAAADKFYGEDRDTKLGLLSYDLAIASFEQMARFATGVQKKGELLRKQTSMLMVQAELLMESKERDKAEENLKKVVDLWVPIFERLKGPLMIHVCLLLFQLKIYFNDLQSAAQYMKFMDNYDSEGKLEEGTEEYVELKLSSAKLKATFDDRVLLTKEKMKRFHLDDA
jgi:hypothetical protein